LIPVLSNAAERRFGLYHLEHKPAFLEAMPGEKTAELQRLS